MLVSKRKRGDSRFLDLSLSLTLLARHGAFGSFVMPHVTRLLVHEAGLLVIDVQEKLMVKIPGAAALERNIAFLIDGARLLDVPVVATEQYPKGLGPTVPELARRVPERPDKLGFSCCAIPSVVDGFRLKGRSRIVLAGIESHVCVLNTALDLLAAEFRVYVAVDAVGSRFAIDHETALRRLERAGVVLTTVETALFEMVAGAQHPRFKEVSALVQERMKGLPSGR
jgi:nicotinamidase-related amidase